MAPSAFRRTIFVVGAVASCGAAAAGADEASESFEENLGHVAERWKHRVFLVVADAGQARAAVDRVVEDPKVLFRKRRVGCAVYIGQQRYLLTTVSVVGDGWEVEVFDEDGRHALARIVGKDQHLDLAVLETFHPLPETEDLPAPEVVEGAPVGTTCIVLGSAYGQSLSASLGTLEGTLEIDPAGVPVQVRRVAAPIFPGDSGGPVVDPEERFLGIVTAACRSQAAVREGSIGEIDLQGRPVTPVSSHGLAVPAETARRAWSDLVRYGYVRRGFLGVEMSSATEGNVGARILSVLPDSPAHRAGIRPGDWITTYGPHAVANTRQLYALVAGTSPQTRVDLGYRRGGTDYLATVEIAESIREAGRAAHPLHEPSPGTPVVQDTRR